MRRYFFIFFLLSAPSLFAQDKPQHFTQFDLSVPIIGNPNRDVEDPNTGEKGYWLLPDGINAHLGYGLHHEKWIAVGMFSGIDWKVSNKFVAVPVFLNLKVSPALGGDTRLNLQASYGKAFVLGRGDLSGQYKKASLGIEDADLGIFLEITEYGFGIYKADKIYSFSIGVSLVTF